MLEVNLVVSHISFLSILKPEKAIMVRKGEEQDDRILEN